MKKLFLFVFALAFCCLSADAQKRCATDEWHQERLMKDADYAKNLEKLRLNYENSSNNKSASIPCGANTITIPVAVHFDASYNCSDVACLIAATDAQIQSLNDDFAAANADLQNYINLQVNTCGAPNVAADGACITFCLADTGHPAATGIPDGLPAITVGEYAGNFATGGAGAIEWAGYLNMFVIDGLGYGVSDGIGGDPSDGSGVAVDGAFWGGPGFTPCSSGGALNDDAAWNLGRTMTHEVGHYLGLWHPFNDGCTATGEPQAPYPVTDTPPQTNPSGGCPTTCAGVSANACNAGEFLQYNFMDYYDDACLVMFTNDQAQAMNDHSNATAWANVGAPKGCSIGATSLAACQLLAEFSPADGADITLCLDDTNTYQLIDETTNGPTSWSWDIVAASGDLVFTPTGAAASAAQNPTLTFTGGTSGVLTITLTSTDVNGITDVTTHNVTFNLASGAACPNECDYTLNLTDDFGDGWNGATLDIQQNGVSIGVFGGAFAAGTADGPYTITLTDGATIDLIQASGGFPAEEGYTLIDPFGNIVAALVDGAPTNQNFVAGCSAPTCIDGIQNGDETGIDCGGATCPTCPVCVAGDTEIENENFDACAAPAGWTVTHDGGASVVPGACANGTDYVLFDCSDGYGDSGGAAAPAGFSGCQAVLNDDNLGGGGATGTGCFVSPAYDLTACTDGTLTFDWEHDEIGGSTFDVEVTTDGGANWTNVFNSAADGSNTGETVALLAYAGNTVQFRFCYNDAAGWAWGAAIDNVAVCGSCGVVACTATPSAISTDISQVCVGVPTDINVTIDTPGTGGNVQYVITDNTGTTILGLPAGSPIDLSGAPAGQCVIWVIDHDGTLTNTATGVAPAVGDLVTDLGGCFSLSNGVAIDRNETTASVISTDVTQVCAGDPTNLVTVTIDTPGTGGNIQYVITDVTGTTILGLPGTNVADLSSAPIGTCVIWVVDHDGTLTNTATGAAPVVGDLVADLGGCFALSNGVPIDRLDCGIPTVTPDVIGSDPCFCGNPLNNDTDEDENGVLVDVNGDGATGIFHEMISLTATGFTTITGITINTGTGLLNFDGTALVTLPAANTPAVNGVSVTEAGGSINIEIYHAASVGYTATFTITGTDVLGNVITATSTQFANTCTPCPYNASIPTLSEWGLITLALMLMSYGTIAMAGAGAFAGTNNVNTPVGFRLPFNAAILRKAFMFTILLAAIGYTMSIVLFGAIFFSDIIGVAIAGPVFAYLAHLLYLAEKNK